MNKNFFLIKVSKNSFKIPKTPKKSPKKGRLTNTVKIGRACFVNEAPYVGALAVVVDIIDVTEVIVQGVKGSLPKRVVNVNHIELLPQTLSVARNAAAAEVDAAAEAEGLATKWEKTAAFKKMERRRLRRQMSDFDRHKAVLLLKKVFCFGEFENFVY